MFNINKPAFGTPSNNTSFFTSTPARFGESFAKPNTPTFGDVGKPQMPPNFGFGNTSSFAPNPFGPAPNNQLFGNSVFNTPPRQPSEIFGSQYEKPSFNFAPKSSGFIFGQNNAQPFKQQSATGIFPSASNFETTQGTQGTVVKFVPVKLTYTEIIKGINQTISGINQCITCMKEYEDKSVEELRWEDYQANRKGQPQDFFFNNSTNVNTEPMAMESPTINVFPQENHLNKNLFGYKFGAIATSSNNPPTGLFGKPIFGFGTTTSNYFGTTNTNTTSNISNFQQQQQQQQPTFNQTTSANIFNRSAPNQSSLFSGLNTNTTFSFGNSPAVTSTAIIGQSTFGQNNLFNTNSLIKPSINTPNIFNTNSYKPAFPSLTNHANTNNIFKYNPTTPQNNNYQQQQQQQQQPQIQINQTHEQILSMSSNPYGLSELLNNIKELDNTINNSSRATNPNELNTLLKTVKPETKKIHEKLQPIHIFRKADQSMFDGLDTIDDINPRNPKKLVLRKYAFINDNNEEIFCSDLSGIFENMNKTSPPRNEETIEKLVPSIATPVEVEEHVETTHPTGITLTRPEYYTVPALEELIDYIDQDGSCIVQGFTVGRLGYGNVYFPEAFDVSNLNLDELVHFCHKEITIYPDDSKKPPRGVGLNRRAQITLDKVWPYDKNTSMLITDVDLLTEMDYADRLRHLCDRQQTKFVDYRPDTGSWVFRVDHFSKYGDEDDAGDAEDSVNYQLSEDFSKCALMKSTFFDDVSETESIHDHEEVIVTPPLDVFPEHEQEQEVEVEVCSYIVPLRKSYFSYFKIYCDVAGFKGRSFKIGWSKNSRFTTLVNPNNIWENSIQINEMKCSSDASFLHHCLEEHLNIQLNNSQYHFNNTRNVPNFSSTLGFTLLKDQEKVCCDKNNFENDIWRLCNALWGHSDNRKQLTSSWLQNVVEKDTVFTLNDGPYNTIMKYLSLNEIEAAAKFAFHQKCPNLSLLISQLPSSISTRNYLLNQLSIWKDMPGLINPELMKIYLLLSGLPEMETICVYEKMSWFQIFGFYLWYIINPEDSIATGINLYEHSFLKNNNIVKPYPLKHDSKQVYDLRFQLLKYYSDNKYPITNILNPLTHTANILDYRFSWFLLQILKSISYCEINPKTTLLVHLNFADQLEQADKWHWSVFILLFIEDVQLKTNLIREIIGRNVQISNDTKEYTAKEKFLIQTLKIPAKWIEKAKATLALQLGRNQEAICYLCYAEKWLEAYNLLMDTLLPNRFFSYDYEFLNKILTPLSHHKNLLPDWEQGGGLILDFARLGIECNTSNNVRFRSSVANIHTRFRDISDLSYLRHVCRNWLVLDQLLN